MLSLKEDFIVVRLIDECHDWIVDLALLDIDVAVLEHVIQGVLVRLIGTVTRLLGLDVANS